MATRDTLVAVSDGDQLNEGYFNGIFTRAAVRAHASSTDATEYSVSATTSGWTDLGYSKTFTPAEGINSWIQAMGVAFEVKNSAGISYYRVKVVNNTTAQAFYLYTAYDSTFSYSYTKNSNSSSYTAYNDTLSTGITAASDGQSVLKTIDHSQRGATYTVTFEVRNYSSAGTAYLTNIRFVAYTSFLVDEEETGWA